MLGFGRIGQQVARRAVGLQMRVVAYDPFVSADRFRELGVESDTLRRACSQRADFITLHLPLNDETRARDRRRTRSRGMKDGVRIVNAARGELIDEAALIDALESGKVAGAAIDVFSQEPYSGPLLEAPNLVVDAAPRRLDRRGAGPRGRDRRRAGRRRARRRPRDERGQHPVGRRRGPRGARRRSSRSRRASAALALELARGEPSRISLEYYGELAEYDTRLLTVAALNGAFRGRVDQPVNYVNAPLIAAERGIEVVEERRRTLTRLHQPDRGLGRRHPRRRHDDRPREPPVARLGARLRASRSSSRRG